jgi:hypothetical protein
MVVDLVEAVVVDLVEAVVVDLVEAVVVDLVAVDRSEVSVEVLVSKF